MPRFEDYVNAVYSYLEAHMPFEKGSIVALRPTRILKESPKLPQNPASLSELNYILGLLTIIIDATVVEYSRGRLYMFKKSELSCIIRLGRNAFIRIIGNLDKIRQRGPEAPSPNPYKNLGLTAPNKRDSFEKSSLHHFIRMESRRAAGLVCHVLLLPPSLL